MFFDSYQRSRARRRGVVLILILGMLALMALIGVTFATFAGQSLVNARNFGVSVNFPGSEQVMDYALAQLINDTNNPLSAIRGHSLLRDMYGNDSKMTGNAGAFHAFLDRLPGGASLLLSFLQAHPISNLDQFNPNNLAGFPQFQTNIPANSLFPQLYNLDFTHWILTVTSGGGINQTFEVLEDNTGTGVHVLTLSASDPVDILGFNVTRIYNNPNFPLIVGAPVGVGTRKVPLFMNQPPLTTGAGNATFTLDGRYIRAFNGPGMTLANFAGLDTTTPPDLTYQGAGQPHNNAAFGNFRVNGPLLGIGLNPAGLFSAANPPGAGAIVPGLGDPNQIGMDEDYDACDLENWFLALQSADGQVMIPSFHRPGILTAQDWQHRFNAGNAVQNAMATMSVAKILRPRGVDNGAGFPLDPIPDLNTGKITFDIDNDGDGVTDSVWLDLGFPIQKDPRGKLFKPLFAFMVIGLNGRLPLNTAGNLQSRDFQAITTPGMTAAAAPLNFNYLPQTYLDGSTWDHASHLGFSVNEINPHFALQNAPNSVYGTSFVVPLSYTQVDNSFGLNGGVGIDTIQLRNILAGTIPQDNLIAPTLGLNQDSNVVRVNNIPWHVPNSLLDAQDLNIPAGRSNAPVPGRWGEPQGIPKVLSVPVYTKTAMPNPPDTATTALVTPINTLIYTNPVRAGRSVATLIGSLYPNTNDAMDDDLDSDDIYPFNSGTIYSQSEGYSGVFPSTIAGDLYGADASLLIPVERIRRYVTPIDPSGVGRVVAWTDRPVNIFDFGNGYDNFGRAGFFRYFRPAGMPKAVTYDNATITAAGTNAYDAAHGYNQPILADPMIPDNTNNLLHGWMSMAAPFPGVGFVPGMGGGTDGGQAVMGSMPYDWTNATTATGDYVFNTTTFPLKYPTFVAGSNVSTLTHYINTAQGPYLKINAQGNDTVNYPPVAVGTPGTGASVVNGYPTYPAASTNNFAAVPGGSLNKDEADEMNLYSPSLLDMPYGPSDLEWLYRKQDIDGAFLNSRLAQLAPVSFLNPADGSTRRRLFSTDSWETINFAYSTDNPGGAFPWNSRFNAIGNAGLDKINYNTDPSVHPYQNAPVPGAGVVIYQNGVVPGGAVSDNTTQYLRDVLRYPPSVYGVLPYPFIPTTSATAPRQSQLPPIVTPALAHRDRKINLNYPLPISNDPAEPVRQKMVREMYQLFKAILPPQAIDTPQELAALSQYAVNIVDFRDPDCSATRFVNTDLIVTPATATTLPVLGFADRLVPTSTAAVPDFVHFPYDPTIYDEQVNPAADWTSQMMSGGVTLQFLVQHGMEYNPVAINEVLAYQYPTKSAGNFTRFVFELVNTLTDDATVAPAVASSSDMTAASLDGWDFIVTDDSTAWGRPDPITGEVAPGAITAPLQAVINGTGALTANQFNFGGSNINAMHLTPTAASGKAYFQIGTPQVAPPTQETPAFQVNDANLPTSFIMPPVSPGSTKWYWLYMRRPANPFDQRPYNNREMIVVDSIRFPYSSSNGKGQAGNPNDTTTPGSVVHYSVQRFQPYRGGHQVDTAAVGAGGAPIPPYAWGYSEQSMLPGGTATMVYWGTSKQNNPPQVLTTQPIFNTIGIANNQVDNPWDYLPFHDRDFTSVAELLVVPGCPPGLFTKVFVETNNPNSPLTTAIPNGPPETAASYSIANFGRAHAATTSPAAVHSFPYLNDEFFYTAASVVPFTNPPTNAAPYPASIGGYTGDGWFKMLEFLEVPSSANGAIGPVANGVNFDWQRQDRKPGLLNLNLIIDEEVFFGLIDDPRLNTQLATLSNLFAQIPQIVTQIDLNGYPAYPANVLTPNQRGSYLISPLTPAGVFPAQFNGRGYSYIDATGNEVHGLKAAFSDFLKLRAGGSGYLFAWGSGATGSGPALMLSPGGNPPPVLPPGLQNLPYGPVAQERPFRSLSYPDINFTVMRPAALPPSLLTNPQVTYPTPYTYQDDAGTPTQLAAGVNYVGDQGVRNPFLNTAPGKRHVPLVPPRRLFEVPDAHNTGGGASGASEYPNVPGTSFIAGGMPAPTAVYAPNQPIIHDELSGNYNGAGFTPGLTGNLFAIGQTINPIAYGAPVGTAAVAIQQYLGWGMTGSSQQDFRQHPYYRTEILQKVMNLTTVRTHQFAVWITVGFFEVLNTGTPYLGHADQLGAELGVQAGKNIRYRSFFILDRTKAVGFNPSSPIDFRDVVTYRRRIE
jgi:hypothetical protein